MQRIDGLTPSGAAELARSIEEYWRNKGYRGVKTWIHEAHFDHGTQRGTFCIVRSNIAPKGYPPREMAN